MSSRSRSRSQNRQETLQSDEYGHQILAEPRHVEFSERDWEGQGGVPNIKVSRVPRAPTPWPSLQQQADQPRVYAGSSLIVPESSVKENSTKEGQQSAEGISASRSHNPSATEQPLPQQAGQPPTYAYGILIEPEYKRKVTPSKEGRQGAGSFAASRFQNTAEVRERLRPRAKQPRLKCHETSATSSDPPGPGALRRSGKFYYPRESQSSATRVQEPAWPASSQKNRVEDSQSGFKKRPRVRDASPGGKYQEVPNRR